MAPVLTARVVLPGLSSSVPTARHFVESVLTAWGHEDSAWAGALLVSELAANCALHARTEFSVQVLQTEAGIRVEVRDGSVRIPQPRTYGADATTGRGLQLVDQIGADWGVIPRADGKTVWVALPSPATPLDDADPNDTDRVLAGFADDETPDPQSRSVRTD